MHEKECKVGVADSGGPRLLFTFTSRNRQSATLDFPARGVSQRGVIHENSAGSCSTNLIRSPFRAITAGELSVEQTTSQSSPQPGKRSSVRAARSPSRPGK